MENLESQMADDIFYMTEDSIYPILEECEKNQAVDESLIYCFVRAFYLYSSKLYMESKKKTIDFENVYAVYKDDLKVYYKTNNPNIEDEILDQVLNFFDNSFGLIGSVELQDIEDSYEFRHYTINVFELLRMILEKKSKARIRENLFDSYIKKVIEQVENIYIYIDRKKN